MVVIRDVEKGSKAEKAGILPGDKLLAIDSHPVKDVLDYRFFITEPRITLSCKRGETVFETEIRKSRYDDIGLEFETFLLDQKRRCANRCIFCFIDQNPCGMRETVYFKDDDTRLSFLMGNYVTLTNVSDEELSRIVKMRLSPVNISVHTTNPELRRKMLGNKNAGKILDQIRVLHEGRIDLNLQIVSCCGINDGKELERTFSDLEPFFDSIRSIAVVPAGLTRHREGLYELAPYEAESAKGVIKTVESYAAKYLAAYGERKVFAADEFYVLSSLPLPEEEAYEGYPQLDNGVGLLRNTESEILDELAYLEESGEIREFLGKELRITVATGMAALAFLRKICGKISEQIPNVKLEVIGVKNDFFGESVTVAGLLCGCDILKAIQGKAIDTLFFPAVSLRHERDRFLDDMTVEEFAEKAGCTVVPVENGVAILDEIKKLVTGGN